MSSPLRVAFFLVGAAIVCVLSGCGGEKGEKLYTVEGRLVQGGQPLTVAKAGGPIQVTLCRVEDVGKPNAKIYSAGIDQEGSDGKFTVLSPMAKGILPAGKYRVGVACVNMSDESGKDRWAGKYDLKKSKFEIDVPTQGEVTIDLGAAAK